MSNAPYYPGPNAAYQPPRPSNGVGVAGFVISLLGFLTCGVLCPLGLLISLFGLAKEPRGFATAGVITGLLGTGILAVFTLVTISGVRAAKSAVEQSVQTMETLSALQEGQSEIESYRSEQGKIPDPITGNELVMNVNDAWDQSLLYAVEDDGTYVLRSAGPDGQFHTEDDIRSDINYSEGSQVIRSRRLEIRQNDASNSGQEVLIDGNGITIEDDGRKVKINSGSIQTSDGSAEVKIDGASVEIRDGNKNIRIQVPR